MWSLYNLKIPLLLRLAIWSATSKCNTLRRRYGDIHLIAHLLKAAPSYMSCLFQGNLCGFAWSVWPALAMEVQDPNSCQSVLVFGKWPFGRGGTSTPCGVCTCQICWFLMQFWKDAMNSGTTESDEAMVAYRKDKMRLQTRDRPYDCESCCPKVVPLPSLFALVAELMLACDETLFLRSLSRESTIVSYPRSGLPF